MRDGVIIDAVLAGKALPFRGDETSAIAKAAIESRVAITRLGLVGDEQADRSVHGGPDKALHHYPFEHYAQWQAEQPDHPKLTKSGAFGENLSTTGLTEEDVCIGDRFRCGIALVEVSQPRQPCWKQAHVMAWPMLPKMMVREAKSGWYYRVIEEGNVAAGDMMSLVDQPHPEWSVARVFRLVMHKSPARISADLQTLRDLVVLENGWRTMAAELLI